MMKRFGIAALEAWGMFGEAVEMVGFAQMWLADSMREQLMRSGTVNEVRE